MSRFSFTAHRAAGLLLSVGVVLTSSEVRAANALSVVSYDAGVNRFQFSAYTNPLVALGKPQTKTGPTFPVTPFNNPFSKNDVVSVGTGGSLVLQLSNHLLPVDGQPELGVFTFQQLIQVNGGTNATPALFYPSVRASIDVSADGLAWLPLNNGDPIAFDIPANAFKDAAGTIPSDYGLPFTGGFDALKNKSSLADTIAAYGGSAGGTWLDVSGTGLSSVDFVRFSVPTNSTFSFQLDAISLSTAATGAPVPEPAIGCAALVTCALVTLRRRR
jgi:hypothetical protein